MATSLNWVVGPWRGKLAMAARPRGGDWLGDEMQQWHQAGVDSVVSLLETAEEADLDLVQEGLEAHNHGMLFHSIPIEDRNTPLRQAEFTRQLAPIEQELDLGKNVVLHCRQGVGRTGLVAACLMLMRGIDPASAVKHLSAARGLAIPETAEQRSWIDHFAESLQLAKH